ncbi:putative GTPase-activating protein [Butyriboletus roseoflavus]|nr:putative GTPase-activating protein [Butyriboletus roseoflavus]
MRYTYNLMFRYDPQVGYCQGLSFVVAVLLLNMPDEQAFCLLVRLMHTYDLRGHFLPEMPKLQLRLVSSTTSFPHRAQLTITSFRNSCLYYTYIFCGKASSQACSVRNGFLTLFSYRFPLDIVFRIYDNCLANGIEAIFAFSIVLLQKNEDVLLTLKFDEILSFLKTRVFEQYKIESSDEDEDEGGEESGPPASYNVDEFVQDAVSLRITPFMLDAYAHEYADLVRAREAHAVEMDTLRNSNRVLTSKVKELDLCLAQLNTEHVDVLVSDLACSAFRISARPTE